MHPTSFALVELCNCSTCKKTSILTTVQLPEVRF
jgi:hypothetical protein